MRNIDRAEDIEYDRSIGNRSCLVSEILKRLADQDEESLEFLVEIIVGIIDGENAPQL